MRKLGQELSGLINSLGADATKFVRIADNNSIYEQAIKKIWIQREAADMILANTNGFYIVEDKTPKKGPDKEKPYMVCEIVASDPIVRSELNARREILQLYLIDAGLQFEDLRILPARRGMRGRHPFGKREDF